MDYRIPKRSDAPREIPTVDRVELRDSPRVRAPRCEPIGLDLRPAEWARYLRVRAGVLSRAEHGDISRKG